MRLPDGGLQDDLATRHAVVSILRELRPSLVFTPWPWARSGAFDGRANVDHLACGLAVREATKLSRMRKLMPEREAHAVRRLVYYMVPDTEKPSYCVDVSAHRAQIIASIEAHASQLEIRRGERGVLDLLMLMREQAGLRLGIELAESFIVEDPLFGSASVLREVWMERRLALVRVLWAGVVWDLAHSRSCSRCRPGCSRSSTTLCPPSLPLPSGRSASVDGAGGLRHGGPGRTSPIRRS